MIWNVPHAPVMLSGPLGTPLLSVMAIQDIACAYFGLYPIASKKLGPQAAFVSAHNAKGPLPPPIGEPPPGGAGGGAGGAMAAGSGGIWGLLTHWI